MNIYDTKVIGCTNCNKTIGEVEFDSFVPLPLCGECVNSFSEGKTFDSKKDNQTKLLIKIPQV